MLRLTTLRSRKLKNEKISQGCNNLAEIHLIVYLSNVILKSLIKLANVGVRLTLKEQFIVWFKKQLCKTRNDKPPVVLPMNSFRSKITIKTHFRIRKKIYTVFEIS